MSANKDVLTGGQRSLGTTKNGAEYNVQSGLKREVNKKKIFQGKASKKVCKQRKW